MKLLVGRFNDIISDFREAPFTFNIFKIIMNMEMNHPVVLPLMYSNMNFMNYNVTFALWNCGSSRATWKKSNLFFIHI